MVILLRGAWQDRDRAAPLPDCPEPGGLNVTGRDAPGAVADRRQAVRRRHGVS